MSAVFRRWQIVRNSWAAHGKGHPEPETDAPCDGTVEIPHSVPSLSADICRKQLSCMVSQKSTPGLGPGPGPPNHIFRYGGLGYVDPDHSKLAVDARSAPQEIVQAHAPNEPAGSYVNGRPAGSFASPRPVPTRLPATASPS